MKSILYWARERSVVLSLGAQRVALTATKPWETSNVFLYQLPFRALLAETHKGVLVDSVVDVDL